MVSYSHAETVPRGEANVSKDCQMNTLESKDRQPCRNLEPLQLYDILSKLIIADNQLLARLSVSIRELLPFD